ncbi:hypothetical protein ACN2MM_00930 [Alkalilimnicola ehrlichii MLHE-1]|uniref:Secreted protein n=1 Tax=Alkalilimnicola ehrlichii (strain ATCC BAA-1101 / DSM 17681 / MLHE-1) TaxID=187272 RepID=Q0ACI8_ALKEH|nr:hypothetical protein [Alkalilimnicola ehrlichii]ABI55449.1 hypothetical protein Mlg_0092 [Alkalilimnicola ehrlichii MLHE-1]
MPPTRTLMMLLMLSPTLAMAQTGVAPDPWDAALAAAEEQGDGQLIARVIASRTIADDLVQNPETPPALLRIQREWQQGGDVCRQMEIITERYYRGQRIRHNMVVQREAERVVGDRETADLDNEDLTHAVAGYLTWGMVMRTPPACDCDPPQIPAILEACEAGGFTPEHSD